MPPLWTPLVEESQPSGLSGPYAHAPCWLKVSLSLKLRCRAPQLPPAVLSGPKIDLFVSKCVKLAKNVYFVCEMCHFVNSPPGAGCERTPFAIKGTLTYLIVANGDRWCLTCSLIVRFPHIRTTGNHVYQTCSLTCKTALRVIGRYR